MAQTLQLYQLIFFYIKFLFMIVWSVFYHGVQERRDVGQQVTGCGTVGCTGVVVL